MDEGQVHTWDSRGMVLNYTRKELIKAKLTRLRMSPVPSGGGWGGQAYILTYLLCDQASPGQLGQLTLFKEVKTHDWSS